MTTEVWNWPDLTCLVFCSRSTRLKSSNNKFQTVARQHHFSRGQHKAAPDWGFKAYTASRGQKKNTWPIALLIYFYVSVVSQRVENPVLFFPSCWQQQSATGPCSQAGSAFSHSFFLSVVLLQIMFYMWTWTCSVSLFNATFTVLSATSKGFPSSFYGHSFSFCLLSWLILVESWSAPFCCDAICLASFINSSAWPAVCWLPTQVFFQHKMILNNCDRRGWKDAADHICHLNTNLIHNFNSPFYFEWYWGFNVTSAKLEKWQKRIYSIYSASSFSVCGLCSLYCGAWAVHGAISHWVFEGILPR